LAPIPPSAANVFLTKSVPPSSLVYYEEKEVAIVPKRGGNSLPTRDEFHEVKVVKDLVGRYRSGAPAQGRVSTITSMSKSKSRIKRKRKG